MRGARSTAADSRPRSFRFADRVDTGDNRVSGRTRMWMGSLIKKRRKKMSKHKYRKRIKANRHKKKR